MCKNVILESNRILKLFYCFHPEDYSITTSVTNKFFTKLKELNDTTGEYFNLAFLWKLYSNHPPYGPLNGGFMLINNLNKIKALYNLGLFQYVKTETSETLRDRAYFSDKKGNIFFDFPSATFDSNLVILTKAGLEFTEKLIQLNEELADIFKTDKKNKLNFDTTIKHADYLVKKTFNGYKERFFCKEKNILEWDILRIFYSQPDLTFSIEEITKLLNKQGYNINDEKYIFFILEKLTKSKDLQRKENLIFNLTEEGNKVLHLHQQDICPFPKSIGSKLSDFLNQTSNTSKRQINLLCNPMELFPENNDEPDTLHNNLIFLQEHNMIKNIPENTYNLNMRPDCDMSSTSDNNYNICYVKAAYINYKTTNPLPDEGTFCGSYFLSEDYSEFFEMNKVLCE